jgi:hypothetical protein
MDHCSLERYRWEMDKNSEALTAALAVCEKEQAASEKERTALEAEERAKREARQRLPGVKIGMTKKQVVDASNWGQPISINETVTGGGTREQWVYGDGHYLYFTNGRVTAVQRSK